jgi:hypothetical protein
VRRDEEAEGYGILWLPNRIDMNLSRIDMNLSLRDLRQGRTDFQTQRAFGGHYT